MTKGVWNSCFRKYASAEPHALQLVSFEPYSATCDLECDALGLSFNDKNQSPLRQRKAEVKEQRIFPYADIDDKYGMLVENEECNLYRALRRLDMEGWYELVEVMKRNRQRVGSQI